VDIVRVVGNRLGGIKLVYDGLHVGLRFRSLSDAIEAAMRALAKLLFGFCQVFGEIACFKSYIWRYLRDFFAFVFLLQVIHSIGLFATTGDHLDLLLTLLIARLSGVALARFLYHLFALKTRLDALVSIVSERVVLQAVPLAELECVRVGIYRARVVARIGFEGGLDNV
jgi:hypothetical protein